MKLIAYITFLNSKKINRRRKSEVLTELKSKNNK